MFTHSYRVSFLPFSKIVHSSYKAARSKYNAHAVNWAKFQRQTSINVHWKCMHKKRFKLFEM